QPNDLGVCVVLFDLALTDGDLGAVRRAVAEIRRIEGPEGALARYGRACELMLQARGGDRSGLDEARRQLPAISGRRPGWSRLALCEAEIATLAGNPSLAIAKYQQAVDQGERDPAVLRRLVELLSAERRYDEASRALRLLPEQTLLLG